MEHISDQSPERPEDPDLSADRAAPDDAESVALWQELSGYPGAHADDNLRDDDALAKRPDSGTGSVGYDVAQRVAWAVVMPAIAKMGESGDPHSMAAGTAMSGDQVVDQGGADHRGDGPTDPPDDTREASDDDEGRLPKRERGDERALSDDERERLLGIGRARILHTERENDTHVLSLPDGNQSSFQVEDSGEQRVATNWQIDVQDRQQDFGVGRRLAKETADELVRQQVDLLDFTISSEAALRTALSVFGDSIEYTDPREEAEITNPKQALELLDSRTTVDGEAAEGIKAAVDMHAFFNNHLAYHISADETVFDRCDFANIQADENGMFGEVYAFRQRILGLPEPHATNATLAFNELLANYESHVSPVNPGEHYEIRVSWVQDPDTEERHIRLANYFFGDVRPGVVEDINLRLSQLGATDAFFGESREAQGAEVDSEDIEAAELLERKGEETTAHLQQSGRGLAAIARVSTRAMVVSFPQSGGGFVIDLKNVEVAREPSGSEVESLNVNGQVDALIDRFLEDYPDD